MAEHAATRSEDNGDAAGCADGIAASGDAFECADAAASGNWHGRDGSAGAAVQSASPIGVAASICERIRCAKKSMRSRAAKKYKMFCVLCVCLRRGPAFAGAWSSP